MSIAYEELSGSPSFVMDRDGGSGSRTIKIAWSDVGRLILEVFPGALFGYPYTASMPGFPWLRASRLKIDPFDPENMTGTGQTINTYKTGAKCVIDYEPYKWPDPDQDDGPGQPEDVTFLEQNITFGGEYLTFPNGGVRWDTDKTGTKNYSTGGGAGGNGDKNFQVREDIPVGIIIPTIEHTMTWNYVSFPPWAGIRNCIGKTNSSLHMNCFPGTLLFNGCTASRTYSITGTPTWKLEYRISEKCYNYPIVSTRGLSQNPKIVNPGSGYRIGDILTITGGAFTMGAGIVIANVNPTTGAVTAIAPNNGQYGSYSQPPKMPNTPFGGFGTGLTITDPFSTIITPAPKGWNYFYRKETSSFEKLVRKNGQNIYQGAEFMQLYGGAPNPADTQNDGLINA